MHIVELSTNKGANSYKLKILNIGNCESSMDSHVINILANIGALYVLCLCYCITALLIVFH